jgi:hypothetical protein
MAGKDTLPILLRACKSNSTRRRAADVSDDTCRER